MKNLAKIIVFTALFAVIVFPVAAEKRAGLLGEWGKDKDPAPGREWLRFEEGGDTIFFSSAGPYGMDEQTFQLISYDGSTIKATYGVGQEVYTFSIQVAGDKLTVSGLENDPETHTILDNYNGTYTKEE